eukprot:gene5711-9531_t
MSQKRSRIIQEILDTEEGYLKSLQDLQTCYFTPLRNSKKFSTVILDSLESNYDEILFVNTELNEQLKFQAKNAIEGSECVGLCFIALEQPFLKAYQKYYLNYENVSTLLRNEKKTNPEFDSFIEEQRKKSPLQFGSYLIMPIQRIRYTTLLKVLIENTDKDHMDYENLENALKVVEQVTVSINTSLRSDSLKEETKRSASIAPKKDKKYAAIEINGKEELLTLEVPGVSTQLSILGQNQAAFVLKKYYEITSKQRRSKGFINSSTHSLEDYTYSEEAPLKCEIVGTENQKIDGTMITLYLVKIQGRHPETFKYIEYTLAKRYRDFHGLHEKFKEYFSMTDSALASSLPGFPQKKPAIFIDHLSQDFIQERRVQLEVWIKSISGKYLDLDFVQQFFQIQNADLAKKSVIEIKPKNETEEKESKRKVSQAEVEVLQEIPVKNLDTNVVATLLDFETGFDSSEDVKKEQTNEEEVKQDDTNLEEKKNVKEENMKIENEKKIKETTSEDKEEEKVQKNDDKKEEDKNEENKE